MEEEDTWEAEAAGPRIKRGLCLGSIALPSEPRSSESRMFKPAHGKANHRHEVARTLKGTCLTNNSTQTVNLRHLCRRQ